MESDESVLAFPGELWTCLQSSTASTTLPSGSIGWNWGAVFNSTNLHAGTGESSNGGLATWTRGLLLGATSGADFDVESSNAELLASDGDILSGLHSGVWRVLISIGFDLHATGHSGDGFFARQIGDVNEGIVIRCVQVADTEHVLAVSDLRSQSNDLLFLLNLLFGRHFWFFI